VTGYPTSGDFEPYRWPKPSARAVPLHLTSSSISAIKLALGRRTRLGSPFDLELRQRFDCSFRLRCVDPSTRRVMPNEAFLDTWGQRLWRPVAFVPRLARRGGWVCLPPGLAAFNPVRRGSRLPWCVPPEHAPVVPES
jgi:hypothetical protein